MNSEEKRILAEKEWAAVRAMMVGLEKLTQSACTQLNKAVKAAPTKNVAMWTSLVQAMVLKFSLELHVAGTQSGFLEETGADAADNAMELARSLKWEVSREQLADFEESLQVFEKGYEILKDWVSSRRQDIPRA